MSSYTAYYHFVISEFRMYMLKLKKNIQFQVEICILQNEIQYLSIIYSERL